MFKRENKFSRTEYEKFLIKNNLSAAAFEANILEQFKKDQLFDFVGGGIVPASFLVAADVSLFVKAVFATSPTSILHSGIYFYLRGDINFCPTS